MSKSDVSRQNLIDEATGDLTEEFQACLRDIFKRFDTDADGVLNNTELDNLTKITNESIVC